jgi:pimeloyl-ACP methyl ester carboxylesterase
MNKKRFQKSFRVTITLLLLTYISLAGVIQAGSGQNRQEDVFSSNPKDQQGGDQFFIVVAVTQLSEDAYDVKLKNPRTGYVHSITLYIEISLNIKVGDRVKERREGGRVVLIPQGGNSAKTSPQNEDPEPPSGENGRLIPEPQPPRVHRPSPIVCTLQQLAALIFERYETGNPIGIMRVTNMPNTYLLVLSGTELEDPEQATHLTEDILENLNLRSAYRDRILAALRRERVMPGSRLIVAGHSLGGMVAQNLAVDPELKKLQIHVDRIITFGSPVTSIGGETDFVFVEAKGDPVLFFSKNHEIFRSALFKGKVTKLIIPGSLFPDLKTHSIYPESETLGQYDALGQEDGRGVCLKLGSFHSYPAPRSVSNQTERAEEIGEESMEDEAKCLGYWPLVSPKEASSNRHGYDAVYWDPKTGAIVISEAKGGYNGKRLDDILGKGYGYQQGTIQWAKAAAERITRSLTTNDKEVRYAELILEALKTGKYPVRIEVFHTEINQGKKGSFKRYVTYPLPRHSLSSGCP